MAIRCSPRTPRAAPETPCAAVRPSVRPSLPPSLGLSAPLRLQTAEREADALAVTKIAPRSLPASAASSCLAPRGPRWLLVAPSEPSTDALPPSKGGKARGDD